MFYYVVKQELGKKRALREDGRILVFKNDSSAKLYTKSLGSNYLLKSTRFHPSRNQSSLYGKKFKLME